MWLINFSITQIILCHFRQVCCCYSLAAHVCQSKKGWGQAWLCLWRPTEHPHQSQSAQVSCGDWKTAKNMEILPPHRFSSEQKPSLLYVACICALRAGWRICALASNNTFFYRECLVLVYFTKCIKLNFIPGRGQKSWFCRICLPLNSCSCTAHLSWSIATFFLPIFLFFLRLRLLFLVAITLS